MKKVERFEVRGSRFAEGSHGFLRAVFVLVAVALTANRAPLTGASAGGAFLKIDHSARSYALGQSGVVVGQGAEAMGSNPANLMELPRKMEVLTAYSNVTDGVSYAHIAGAINRSTKRDMMVDALGFSYTRLAVSGIEGRDGAGRKTADFGSSDSQMSMSLSGNAGKVKVGLTGKIVQSKIGEIKANTAIAGDAGVSYGFKAFGKEMLAGASVNNFGQRVGYVSQKDSLPTTMNLGVNANAGPLNLMGGVSQQMKGGTNLNFGMEFTMGSVSLRAGMNALGGTSGNKSGGSSGLFEGLSSGIGLKLGMARVDYAVGQQSQDLGINQRLTLTLQFGRKAN